VSGTDELVDSHKEGQNIRLTCASGKNLKFEKWRFSYYHLKQDTFFPNFESQDGDPPFDILTRLFDSVPSEINMHIPYEYQGLPIVYYTKR